MTSDGGHLEPPEKQNHIVLCVLRFSQIMVLFILSVCTFLYFALGGPHMKFEKICAYAKSSLVSLPKIAEASPFFCENTVTL